MPNARRPRIWGKFLLACLIATALGGCASMGTRLSREDALRRATLEDPRTAARRFARIGHGDRIKLTIFGEPDLSGEYRVGALGKITVPLMGRIKAAGLTQAALQRNIRNRLHRTYLKHPRVHVEVVGYQPLLVHGEVRKPGPHEFRPGLTVADAIALAGGYTYRANERYVLLLRRGWMRPLPLSLPSRAIVLPGDNIRIPERFF